MIAGQYTPKHKHKFFDWFLRIEIFLKNFDIFYKEQHFMKLGREYCVVCSEA